MQMLDEPPSVDVVILSWNRLESTLAAIENILEQQGVLVKVWLVDQGSDRDGLLALREIANKDKRVNLYEVGKNIGVAAGRNLGMSLGSAEVIVAIDNDAEFADKHALRQVVERFQNYPQLAAIGFRINNYYSGDLDLGSWVYPKALLPHRLEQFGATRFCGAGHAIRRSALEKTNGYNEDLFFYWEELDLSYKFINAAYDIIYDPSVVVLHKVSAEARTDWQGKRYYYLVRNALFLDWKYFRSVRRLLMLALGYQIKAFYNRVPKQGLRGIREGLRMARQLPKEQIQPLSVLAQAYILEHDLKHRGGMWQRFRTEVLADLS